MRIGLDIDNVIADFDKKIIQEFHKEDKKKRGKGLLHNNNEYWLHNCDWSREEIETFFNMNMQNFAKFLEPIKNAKYYMDKLLSEGHKLYLITNRVFPHYTDPYEITKNWLAENEIHYTKLILSETRNKSGECKEHNIDIMFDDSKNNCNLLQENGVNCYLMTTKYNTKNRDNLRVVNDWKELYEVIKNMTKKK